MEKEASRCPALKPIFDRHIMQLAANIQLAKIIAKLGYKAAATSARFKEHMETRTKNVSCTQLVEDINGVQAVASDTHNRKFRLPATALAYVLKKDPVADRHKYENVEIKRTAPRRSPHLDRDLFEPRTANQSLHCSEVVSTDQTQKW